MTSHAPLRLQAKAHYHAMMGMAVHKTSPPPSGSMSVTVGLSLHNNEQKMKGGNLNIERHTSSIQQQQCYYYFHKSNQMKSQKNPNSNMKPKSKTIIIISPSFPPEIITEILLKLPIESLLRCKSVCKEWYSLISDRYFIRTHYTLSSTTTHRLIYTTFEQRNNLISCPLYDVLVHKSVNNALRLDIPLQRSERVRIVGSCNGLMCIREEFKDTLFIYNSTTRRSNLLPSSQQIGFHGFGYDELSRDYKVVIPRIELPTIIYSLKTGKWKEIGHFPCGFVLNYAKFTNGTLHWATSDESSLNSWKIVSLDLANETYGEVLQPEYHKGDEYLELGVAGEWLCVLNDYWESPMSDMVDVWVMKVYGVKDSWTKLASIPYPDHWRDQVWAPLCISKDGKLLLQFGLQWLIYDLKDSSSSVIENKYYEACIVLESLVSPFPPLSLADKNEDED